MTPPALDAARPGKSKLWWGLGLILAGLLAWFLEYRAGRDGTILLEVPLKSADFADVFVTSAVPSPADRVYKIRVMAPVDNSWMTVRVSAVDQTGRSVDECRLKLEFYHGMHDGRSYQTGATFDSAFLRVPSDGLYRFHIGVIAGQGDSAEPQTLLAGKPLRFHALSSGTSASRWRLAIFVAAPTAGLALILPALARRCRKNGKVPEAREKRVRRRNRFAPHREESG